MDKNTFHKAKFQWILLYSENSSYLNITRLNSAMYFFHDNIKAYIGIVCFGCASNLISRSVFTVTDSLYAVNIISDLDGN